MDAEEFKAQNTTYRSEFESTAAWIEFITNLLGVVYEEIQQESDDIDRVFRQREIEEILDIINAIEAGEATIEDLQNYELDFLADKPAAVEWYDKVVNAYLDTEQPPELPVDDLRGGLYDWFIENASDFPIEDAEWLLETFGVSIEDIPTFIENASAEELGTLEAYKNVVQTEGWENLEDWEKDRIKDGDLVVLAAFGSGFTWGSVIIRW